MYVKLVRDMLRSSLNDEHLPTRWTFVACCLMADWNGYFRATPSAIAREANLTIDEVRAALDVLSAPDPATTTPDDDGVRVRDLGHNHWHVVNIKKYRATEDIDNRRKVDAERQRRHRDKATVSRDEGTMSRDSNVTSRHKEEDLDKEEDQDRTDQEEESPGTKFVPAPSPRTDPLKRVSLDEASWSFEGITDADRTTWQAKAPAVNIDRELDKMIRFYQSHPGKLAQRRKGGRWVVAIENWLVRAQEYSERGNNTAATSSNWRDRANTQEPTPPPPPSTTTVKPATLDAATLMDAIAQALPADVVSRWLPVMSYIGDTDTGIVIECPDDYSTNHIRHNFRAQLVHAATFTAGHPMTVKVVSREGRAA